MVLPSFAVDKERAEFCEINIEGTFDVVVVWNVLYPYQTTRHAMPYNHSVHTGIDRTMRGFRHVGFFSMSTRVFPAVCVA